MGHNDYGISAAEITFIICEAICICFYGLFCQFDQWDYQQTSATDEPTAQQIAWTRYPYFQDVHIMIFVGFGFLMVFLKNNSWCSIGFNYLIACWAIQICILFTGFWHNITHFYNNPGYSWTKISLNYTHIIMADFGAGAVLISFGAILGKCSIFQLWAMATIEVFFYCLNEAILTDIF